MKRIFLMLPALGLAGAASAQSTGEIGYPQGSLGYEAIVQANYGAAEKQIQSSWQISREDPARLINLGGIYAKTGRKEEALKVLTQALNLEDVELILANGETVGSRDAARRALAQLRK